MGGVVGDDEKARWVARVLGVEIGDPVRPAGAYADLAAEGAENSRPAFAYAAPDQDDARREPPVRRKAATRPASAYADVNDARPQQAPPANANANAYATLEPAPELDGGRQPDAAGQPVGADGAAPPAPEGGSVPRHPRVPNPSPAPPIARGPPAPVMRQFDPARASFGEEIKGGAFGMVSWLDTTQPGAPPLVIKVPHTEATRQELEHEAAFYAKAGDHPNVAKCYGMQDVAGQKGLVLEGIKGRDMAGTVATLEKLRTGDAASLRRFGLEKQLSQEAFVGTLQYMITQMPSGLAHLEEQGVIHNDIRPDNIMCDQATGAVKIVDFGLAKNVGDRAGGKAPIRHASVAPEFGSPTTIMSGKHDVFGAGEAVRKSMEGDQFRYNTGKEQKVLNYDDMRAFAKPDAAGNAQRALNPAQPPELLDERMEKLGGRAAALLANPAFRETEAGAALATAVPRAQEQLNAAQTLADAEDIVRALDHEVSGAEAQAVAATGGAPESGDRWSTLFERLNALMSEPFIKGTPAMVDLTRQRHDMMLLWNEKDRLPPQQRTAELDKVEARVRHDEERLKKTGQFGAATDYTRFVNWVMNPDPAQRPTAAEALRHPFLTDRLLDDASAQAVLMSVLASSAPTTADSDSDSDSGTDSDSWSDSGSASGSEGSMPPGGAAIEANSGSGSVPPDGEMWEQAGGGSGSAAPSI